MPHDELALHLLLVLELQTNLENVRTLNLPLLEKLQFSDEGNQGAQFLLSALLGCLFKG